MNGDPAAPVHAKGLPAKCWKIKPVQRSQRAINKKRQRQHRHNDHGRRSVSEARHSPSLGALELRLRLGSNLSFSCPSDALPRGTTLPRSAERRDRERKREIREAWNESSRVRHRFYFNFFFFYIYFFVFFFCVLNRSCLFVCISSPSYSFVFSFKSKCLNNLGFSIFFFNIHVFYINKIVKKKTTAAASIVFSLCLPLINRQAKTLRVKGLSDNKLLWAAVLYNIYNAYFIYQKIHSTNKTVLSSLYGII